jgi:hypothetical protein
MNASGNLSVGDHVISAALPLAGQRVTLRLDGPVAHILCGGTLVRTALAATEAALARLDAGRFGWCQQCGSAITATRLAQIPQARYCPACQP